jgi:hypothetical protein
MFPTRTTRRTLLAALATVPGLRLLFPTSAAVAQDPFSRDVIRELGVRPCINAAGTYTALTGSLMPPEVVAGIQVASRQYVRLNELQDAVGKRIAELLKCESAMVSAGCASALSLATAACVAGSDPDRIRRIPDTTGMKNECLVQATHRVGYDHAIRNAGVRLIEIETAEELEKKITDKTALLFFLNSSDPQGKIHHEEFVAIGKILCHIDLERRREGVERVPRLGVPPQLGKRIDAATMAATVETPVREADGRAVALIRASIEHGGREQLGAILQAIESTGGLKYTARLARAEADQALAALGALPESPFREGLAALTRFAIERKH